MSADPVADTSAGRVRGRWRDVDGRSAAFLGIPYAEPPVGELRFAAPVPRTPWDGERDATGFGATPQRIDGGETLIPEPAIAGEDILSVNVFTPRLVATTCRSSSTSTAAGTSRGRPRAPGTTARPSRATVSSR